MNEGKSNAFNMQEKFKKIMLLSVNLVVYLNYFWNTFKQEFI